jgi:ABC-type multidrug transport system fused ATPase/permease subunit
VNLVWAALVVAVVVAVAVALMLLVRRGAPDGSYFADGDRAAGVFGVLATGFAVLLGFIVFLAFDSYDTARSGAENEAVVLGQQVETAQFLPEPQRAALTGELVCYGRAVAGEEWDRMEAGTLDDAAPNQWSDELFRTLRSVRDPSDQELSALDRWLDQRSERERARNDRIHGASGVIPLPLWIVLFFLSGVILLYMLFFADSGERVVTQAVMMGTVAALITSLLLLVAFLDDPFQGGVGGLRPTSMERTLRVIDQEIGRLGLEVDPPCDAQGRPR